MGAKKKDTYQVVVGNVGTVYDGSNKEKALKDFNAYVAISKSGKGRAGGEDVCIIVIDGTTGNQDILKEHTGHLAAQRDI